MENKEQNEKTASPIEPVVMLLPCPFCGCEAEVKRMGTNRVSMIIGCTNCGCNLETGETWIDENINWNNRAPAFEKLLSMKEFGDLLGRQCSLDKECADILYKNLEDLYET